MYHQIKVKESNKDALRFVWRNTPEEEIDDHKVTVHIFVRLTLLVQQTRLLNEQHQISPTNIQSISLAPLTKFFTQMIFQTILALKIGLLIQFRNLFLFCQTVGSLNSYPTTKISTNLFPPLNVLQKLLTQIQTIFQQRQHWLLYGILKSICSAQKV